MGTRKGNDGRLLATLLTCPRFFHLHQVTTVASVIADFHGGKVELHANAKLAA